MGEHEHRSVERRIVAPPALPIEVLPRAALWTELVATHDLGTDVARIVASEVVVEAAASAPVCAVRPIRGGEGPRTQLGRVRMSERLLQTLTFARAEPIGRDEKAMNSQ